MLRLSPYPLSALVSTIHSRAHGHSCNFSPVELKVWLVYHRNLLLITRTKPTRSNNSTRQGSFIWSRFGRAFVGSTGQGLRSIILNHFHPLENCDYLSHAPWCRYSSTSYPTNVSFNLVTHILSLCSTSSKFVMWFEPLPSRRLTATASSKIRVSLCLLSSIDVNYFLFVSYGIPANMDSWVLEMDTVLTPSGFYHASRSRHLFFFSIRVIV